MASMVARRIVAAIDGLSLSVIILFDYLIQDGVLPELASKYVTSGIAALVTVLHLVLYAAGYDLKLARRQIDEDRNIVAPAPRNPSLTETVKYNVPANASPDSLHVPDYMREYHRLKPTAPKLDNIPMVTTSAQPLPPLNVNDLNRNSYDKINPIATVKSYIKPNKVTINPNHV
uniref:Uncharacterized protein n=1 Tax=viral metagenome TaxID=1070528 RepID=A0A2V0RMD7_9ZZZZ